jgi:O-antigen/teichoic acid export membrane protein
MARTSEEVSPVEGLRPIGPELEPAPTAPEETTVGRAVAWLTGASLIQRASSFVLTVIMRGILGPTLTGVWNLVQVWTEQLAGLTLGVHWAADREMPMLRAQGRTDEEDEVRGVTFTYLLAEATAIAVAFWAYWALARGGWSTDEALGLALVPILATIATVHTAYQLFLKNKKAFKGFAWSNIAMVAVDWAMLAFLLIGGFRLLLIGLVFAAAARVVIYVAIVRRLRLFRIPVGLSKRVLLPMLRFGLPLSLWAVGYSLILRLDSLVVGTSLGATALGFYYFGPQVATALSDIPTSLSVVSYPNLMERFGRAGPAALAPHLKRYLRALGLVFGPLSAAAGVFGIEVAVASFLPEFDRGIGAMQVVLLTLLFRQPGYLLVQILLAVKRVRLLVVITAAAAAVQAGVLAWAVIADELTIKLAAWSSVAAQGTFALLALGSACHILEVTGSELWRFWARLPGAWIAFGALTLTIAAVVPGSDTLLGRTAWALLELGVFTAAGLGILLLVDRGALRSTRQLLRGSG